MHLAPPKLLSRLRGTGSAGNFGWLLFDRVVRMGLGIAANVVVARALGPDSFGQLAYAMTLAALFLPLSTLGSERIVVRELARGTLEPQMLGTVVPLRLTGAFVGWLLAVVVAVFSVDTDRAGAAGLVAIVVAGNLFLAFDVVGWAFQARGNFRPPTVGRLIGFVLGATLRIVLARTGADIKWIAAAVLVEAAIGAVAQFWAWSRANRNSETWAWNIGLARVVLFAGAPLLAAEIAVWVFQKIDVVILQRYAAADGVGVYSVAQRAGQVAFFLPVVAVQVFSPAVAQAADAGAALALVKRTMMVLVTIAYGIALSLCLAAGPIVHFLFGAKFAASAPVLAILAWSNVFVFMGCAHSLYLVNRGHQALSLRLAWLTAIVSIALNLVLIPRYGALGAAIANVSTYALTTVFGVALYKGSRPLLRVNLMSLAGPVWLLRLALRRPQPESIP